MKLKIKTAFVVLSSVLFLTGCVKDGATRTKLVMFNVENLDSFNVVTNLEETKEIHTEQQKEYLSYDGEYVSIPEANYPDGTKHLSDPEPVKLEWNFTVPSDKTLSHYDVVVGKEADLKDGYAIKGTTDSELNVYNSYLGDNYFKVVANYSDGTTDSSKIMKYKVDNVYPRNVKIDGMTNCRDMGGGRELVDGGHIKQGLIYRTSSTKSWGNGRAVVTDTITSSGKEVLFNQLGCKTEINVNNSGSKQDGVENYVEAYMWYDSGKHHLYRNAEPIKEVFHALANPDNYPIFYHCRIGTDRTGLCAILISSLLGVPENLIYQDYLFSNFGNIQEKRYIGEKAGRDNILNYINDLKAFPGEKLQNKVYNYLLSIGVPASELNSIIDILVEGTKPQGNNNGQAFVGADEFLADGTEMKTIPETAKGNASRAHPKQYYTLGADQSVKAGFDAVYEGEATLVAYLGSTDSSSSKKISDSIEAEFNYDFVEINETTFADAGFGSGDSRTYYAAIQLAKVHVNKGYNEVTIHGLANNLNIGAISVLADGVVDTGENAPSEEPNEQPAKKGCGGSIVMSVSLMSLLAFSGVAILVIKKRKED